MNIMSFLVSGTSLVTIIVILASFALPFWRKKPKSKKQKVFTFAAVLFGIITLINFLQTISILQGGAFYFNPYFFVPPVILRIPFIRLVPPVLFIALAVWEQRQQKKREEQISETDKLEEANKIQEANGKKEELLLMLEPLIKAQLKSPISAIFCNANELLVAYDIDNVYNITGYVNSQNSYGAMIKTGFSAKAKYENGKWEIIKAGMENALTKMLAANYIIAIFITLILFAVSYLFISMLL